MSHTQGSTDAPQHAKMNQFAVAGNCLQIGGQSLPDLARAVGKTPFYAYDRQVMNDRVKTLRDALPPGVHLHYAVKANPMPEVVNHLAAMTDGLDVASANELRLALATGIAPGSISFAGPGKSAEDLDAAVASGVIINMESAGEMQRIAALAESTGIRPRVAIRVNPDFELKSAGMKMGSGPKPFGVDAEQVPAMLEAMSSLPLEFMGFHIFSGSQNLRPQAIIESQTKTFELAFRLSQSAPSPVRWLNIGGGLGVPYFPGEQHLDLSPIASNLAGLARKAAQQLPGVEIVLELGRYLTAEAGIYVCEVVDKKVSRGETFLVTNGGLHHHLAASGNFGQVIRKNYPLCLGNRVSGDTLELVNVVGPLCTPLDILGSRVSLPVAEVGDLVVVFQSGAYGLTASPVNFLGHPHPGEILV
ncbi:MAG: pyridoxal-dependent decarboxylase, exosortase A system-associated [Halioglobus sp.]|nr:pyridoxal-dependent decarboxylase, exosortase A system-associated [Halioglobus sp.]